MASILITTSVEATNAMNTLAMIRIGPGRDGADLGGAALGQWAAVVARAAMAAARVAFRAALTGEEGEEGEQAGGPSGGRLGAELRNAFKILEDGCRAPGVSGRA
jgi:hypothetical protein